MKAAAGVRGGACAATTISHLWPCKEGITQIKMVRTSSSESCCRRAWQRLRGHHHRTPVCGQTAEDENRGELEQQRKLLQACVGALALPPP